MFAKRGHRGRALRRHDGDELRPRRRAASSHGLDELAKPHFDHECIPLQGGLRDRRRSRSPSTRCRSTRRPNMPPRTPTSRLRLWQRLKPRLTARARRRGSTRWSTGRWSPVIGADGAARGQGRPRLSRQAVGASSRPRSRRSRSGSTRRPAGPFTIGSPAAAGRGAVTTGWA